jgi:hypothetical protein
VKKTDNKSSLPIVECDENSAGDVNIFNSVIYEKNFQSNSRNNCTTPIADLVNVFPTKANKVSLSGKSVGDDAGYKKVLKKIHVPYKNVLNLTSTLL